MKFDVITIGTATRDVFLQSPLFKGEIKNPAELKKLGIYAEEATCFGLGSKIGIDATIKTPAEGRGRPAAKVVRPPQELYEHVLAQWKEYGFK